MVRFRFSRTGQQFARARSLNQPKSTRKKSFEQHVWDSTPGAWAEKAAATAVLSNKSVTNFETAQGLQKMWDTYKADHDPLLKKRRQRIFDQHSQVRQLQQQNMQRVGRRNTVANYKKKVQEFKRRNAKSLRAWRRSYRQQQRWFR